MIENEVAETLGQKLNPNPNPNVKISLDVHVYREHEKCQEYFGNGYCSVFTEQQWYLGYPRQDCLI